MTLVLEDAVTSIRNLGLVPVPLKLEPSDDDPSCWEFSGALEEFLIVAKELGARAVYLTAHKFDEEYFVFSPDDEDADENYELDDLDDDGDDVEENESEAIDLADMEPRLEPFKSRIGEVHCVSLLIVTVESKLRLELFATWFEAFESLSQSATERLRASADERRNAIESMREKQHAAARTTLIEQLERLPTDTVFRDLPTKGARTAYVNEHFPSAKGLLGPSLFREKVAELNDRALLERARR